MQWIEQIKNYNPYNKQEYNDKELILQAIERNEDILKRENKAMHITVSSYIMNEKMDKVLMIYHKIYNSWSWCGGHADGDANLMNVALKEGVEETGVKNLKLFNNDIISIDVLTVKPHIKKGQYISAHLHLNVTYLLIANENEMLVVNEDETKGVKWISINEIEKYSTEKYMIENVYNKINQKILL